MTWGTRDYVWLQVSGRTSVLFIFSADRSRLSSVELRTALRSALDETSIAGAVATAIVCSPDGREP